MSKIQGFEFCSFLFLEWVIRDLMNSVIPYFGKRTACYMLSEVKLMIILKRLVFTVTFLEFFENLYKNRWVFNFFQRSPIIIGFHAELFGVPGQPSSYEAGVLPDHGCNRYCNKGSLSAHQSATPWD